MNLTNKQWRRTFQLSPPAWLIAGFSAGVLAVISRPCISYGESVQSTSQMRYASSLLTADDDQGGDEEVPTAQLEKYVSVYKAMQRNRSLTVEQAAASQGLTLQEFRELENRVQRDDAALQQARDELQAAAKQTSTAPENAHHPQQ